MAQAPQIRREYDRWLRQGEYTSLARHIPEKQLLSFAAIPELLTVDMSRCALLIIDMQNDFLDPSGWFGSVRGEAVSALSSLIPTINDISAQFRRYQAPVIHLNWGVRSDVANLPANVLDKGSACGTQPAYGDSIESGDVLVDGSWGGSSSPGIKKEPTDISVSKHRLSGFRDNELDQMLRRLGTTTLFYTGVNLDRCVFATLADGCFQGYDAILVEDATSTVSPAYVSEAIAYLVRLLYGHTTSSAELLTAFENTLPEGK